MPAQSIDVTASPYNADATGATDASGAINSALTAAAAAGKRTFAPQGTYLIKTNPINVPSDTVLFGEGNTNTLFKADPTLVGSVIRNTDQTNGNATVKLADFEVDANRLHRGSEAAAAIFFGTSGTASGRCSDFQMLRVVEHEAPALGVQITNTAGVVFEDNELYNNTREGVNFTYSCSDLTVRGNNIHDVGDDCIGLNAEQGSYLLDTTSVTGTVAAGSKSLVVNSASLLSLGQNITVVGAGSVDGTTPPSGYPGGGLATVIDAISGTTVTLHDAAVVAVTGAHVTFAIKGSATSGTRTLTVTSNVGITTGELLGVVGAGASGAIYFGTVSTIVGTTVTMTGGSPTFGTTVAGAKVSTGTTNHSAITDVLISDNRLRTQHSNGANISLAGVQRAVVSGNICDEGYGGGIQVSNHNQVPSSDVLVCDNVVRNAGKTNTVATVYGITVSGGRSVSSYAGETGCDGVTVRDNIVIDPKSGWLRITGTPAASVVNSALDDNVLRGTAQSWTSGTARGVEAILGKPTDVEVSGNRILAVPGDAIKVGDGTANFKRWAISDNKISDQGGQGINVTGCLDLSVTRNRMRSSGVGVRLSSISGRAIISENDIDRDDITYSGTASPLVTTDNLGWTFP